MSTTTNRAQEAALRLLGAGLGVIPVKTDGSKAPDLDSWSELKGANGRLATEEEINEWFGAPGKRGMGVVCGIVSKDLGVLDFEIGSLYEEWAALVEIEAPGLLARLPKVITPGKGDERGRHVYARFPTRVRTRKLARIPEAEAIARFGDKGKITAIEMRGEGSQVLAPGCPSRCHPSGRLYEACEGPRIEEVPTVTPEEARLLIHLARGLDRSDKILVDVGMPKELTDADPASGEKPGQAFNRLGDWAYILTRHGWALARQSGAVGYWRRPGKDAGISATTGHCTSEQAGELFYVFSTNAGPFEEGRAYSKFATVAMLEHGGDFKAAAGELGRQGYGDRPTQQKTAVVVSFEQPDIDEPSCLPPPAGEPLPFPLVSLPASLAEYAVAIGRSVACPPDFAAIAMLAYGGAAIGSSRALAVTRKWLESPRLFVAVIADPGGGKSPSIELVAEPIVERQNRLHADWQQAQQEYESELACYEAARKNYVRARASGETVTSVPEKPVRPVYRHLYTRNPTVEALTAMLQESPRGIIYDPDEIASWATSMNQYKAGGKGSDRQFWLSVWSGNTAKTDRKGDREKGSQIAHKPFLSVLGGIQPDMISQLADERGRDDGFIHRVLFSMPREFPWARHIAPPPEERLELAWRSCLSVMWGWEMRRRDDGTWRPHVVEMTPGGRAVAEQWYAEHADERNSSDFPAGMGGPWSKLRSYFFRLALTVHCLRVACGEADGESVDERSMVASAALIDYFKSHARLVYARLHSRPEDLKAERLLAWIARQGQTIRPRDLIAYRMAKKSSEAEEMLRDLADRGYGTFCREPTASSKQLVWVFRRR